MERILAFTALLFVVSSSFGSAYTIDMKVNESKEMPENTTKEVEEADLKDKNVGEKESSMNLFGDLQIFGKLLIFLFGFIVGLGSSLITILLKNREKDEEITL